MRSPQETLTTAPHPCVAPHCQQAKGQAIVRFQSLSRQADIPSSAAPLHTSSTPRKQLSSLPRSPLLSLPLSLERSAYVPGCELLRSLSAHPRGLRPGTAGCLGEAHISVGFTTK